MGLEPLVVSYRGKACEHLSPLCLFGNHATCEAASEGSIHANCDCPCHDEVLCSLCPRADAMTAHELLAHAAEAHRGGNLLGVANDETLAALMQDIKAELGPDLFERRKVDHRMRVLAAYRVQVLGMFTVSPLPDAATRAGAERQVRPLQIAACNQADCEWSSDPHSDVNIARQCLDHLIGVHAWDDDAAIARLKAAATEAMRPRLEDEAQDG